MFVITNASDEDFYRHARQYFAAFPRQQVRLNSFMGTTAPVVGVGPDPGSAIQAPWSFQSLVYNTTMESIRRGRDKDAVTVCHGTFAGQGAGTIRGLRLPLTDQTSVFTVGQVLGMLIPLLNDPSRTLDTNAVNQAERSAGLPAGTLMELFNVLVAIRFEHLNRVVILACQLGTDINLLTQFGQCLGCTFIDAPDSDVYFGQIDVPAATGRRGFAPTRNVAGWVANQRGARLFTNSTGPGSIGIQMVPDPSTHQAAWNFAADTRNLAWFINQFLMPASLLSGTTPPGAYVIPFHVIRDGASLNFFLPAETGYAQHLVEVGPLPGAEFRIDAPKKD